MNNVNPELSVKKLATGIPGFDDIALGGLPEGRAALVAGTSGSAKTVFAAQFLAAGIMQFDQPGVFITFEEAPADICKNMASLGWDIRQWEQQGKWAFVDASPQGDEQIVVTGSYDLGALLARIESAVRKTGAKRVVLDSIGVILTRFPDAALVRAEMFRIISALKEMDSLTALITAERTEEYGEISRYGVEEFVSDNVIVMRNTLEVEIRSRTIEILKFRGAPHRKGEHPFTVVGGSGITVIATPQSAIPIPQSTVARKTFGDADLDQMCGGGLLSDAVSVVSGAAGCGKTLFAASFIAGGIQNGERCALFSFEESHGELLRNARSWGLDLAAMEQQGLLKLVCINPESAGLMDHLLHIKQVIGEFRPSRMAVDSLSALERIATVRGYCHFLHGLAALAKQREIALLFTTTAPLSGGASFTEAHISSLMDNILLLRYVELFGEIRRGLAVLKTRGTSHDRNIREFTIDGSGLHVGRPFQNVSGILAGAPRHQAPGEMERMGGMFGNEE